MEDIIKSKKFKPIILHIKKKSFDEALKLLKVITPEEKELGLVYNLYASIYAKKNQWALAIDYYKKLLETEENKNNIYYLLNNIAYGQFFLGKINESIKYYTEATKINSSSAHAYQNLGITYIELGKYELAINNLVIALNLQETNIAKKYLIEIFNYYQPKNINSHNIIKINHEISELDTKSFNKFPMDINKLKCFLKESQNKMDNLEKNLIFKETQIFRKNNINLNCGRHFKIFNEFNIIPKYCFNCYKVQINLENVVDLIKLFFIFNNFYLKKNNIRKCMIETRESVKGNYKGYIYCNGTDEAKEVDENIREKIKNTEIIPKNIEIKHGCTEYYDSYPDYKSINFIDEQKMTYPEEWNLKEKLFDDRIPTRDKDDKKVFDQTLNKINLSDILIIKNWLIYAKIIGDDTYKKIFDDKLELNFLKEKLKNQINFRKKNIINFRSTLY